MRDQLSLDDSLTITPDVVFRELEGEGVVLNLETGTYFGLDEVGARIWQLVETHGRLRAVFDILCDEYEAAPETIERDLLELATRLTASGLAAVQAR